MQMLMKLKMGIANNMSIKLNIEAPDLVWTYQHMGDGGARYDLMIVGSDIRFYRDRVASIFCFKPQQYIWEINSPYSRSVTALCEGIESSLDRAKEMAQIKLKDLSIIIIED